VPSETRDRRLTSISTRLSPWPSTSVKPCCKGPSKRSSDFNSNDLGISNFAPTARVPVRCRKHLEPSQSAAALFIMMNRSAVARPVAGIFFPLRPSLRLDSHNFSPAILGKLIRASAKGCSFEDAAESLRDLAEVTVSGRQAGRIAHEVGEQLRQRRDQQVDDLENHRLEPRTTVAPRLAVIALDGGRLQTRSEGQGPGVHDSAWREDKVANLVTMTTQSHDNDPHPELPRCFSEKRKVVELVQGVTSQGALADVFETPAEEEVPLTVFEPTEDEPESHWPPKPLVRTCQATSESSEMFGPMVAAEAKQRNFFAAQSRALLGDGGAWIWVIHRVFFPTFEPIIDFVHVLTYIYLAAKAVGGSATVTWERYLRWARACWQGQVATVLEELGTAREGMALPAEAEDDKTTDPYQVITRTIGYLENNRSRMDYPRYRCAGLPISSALVESLIKQFNRRVKGTEKFWNETQAETILQLRAAHLSEDDRLSEHLKKRPISPFRAYETAKRRKSG
jgi:hypothetical protein